MNEKKLFKKNKSYYREYLKYFMIVLLVPMLTVCIIVSASKVIVEKQVLNSGRNTLHQLFEYVDEVLLDAKNLSVSLTNSDDLQLYSRAIIDKKEKGTYYSWKVKELLNDNMNSKYYDIFCYYPERDYIVSGINASMDLESYYDIYYDKENDFLDEFRNVAECAMKRPTIINMNGNSADSYQCIVKRQSTGNVEYDFVTVIVIKSTYLSETLPKTDSGSLVLWNEEGENLLFAEENWNVSELGIAQNMYDTSDDMIEKDGYYILTQNSKVLDFYYTYLIPKDYFWHEMLPLYAIWGIGTALSAIIGIVIAWRQTQKAYLPIGNIIVNTQNNDVEEYDAKEKTEFEYIEHLMQRKREENKSLNDSLHKMERVKRNALVTALLDGKVKGDMVLEDLFKKDELKLCSEKVCVVCFKVESELSEIMRFAIVNVFEELMEREQMGYVVTINQVKFAILVNLKDENSGEILRNLLKEGQQFWQRFSGGEISFGISSEQEGVDGIKIAYEEAQHALKYVFLLGKNKIISYDEISEREVHYVIPSETKTVQAVIEFMSTDGAKKNEKALIRNIMKDYELDEKSSIEAAECYKYAMLNILNRVCVYEKCRLDDWDSLLQELLNSYTLEQFNEYLEKILLQLYGKKQEQIKDVDICTRAVEYIENNYSNVNLSRTFLGEQLGISYPYLARLFKEKYQTTITDYIIDVRIQRAKWELSNTEHGIQKIAENIGFTNSQTFIRTFKKMEGITPGSYREQHKVD